MKSRLMPVVAALSLFAAGHAMAEGALPGAEDTAFPGPAAISGPAKTRAEVQADLARAIADGQLVYTSEGHPAVKKQVAGTKSRAEVRADLAQAFANGQMVYTSEGHPATKKQG